MGERHRGWIIILLPALVWACGGESHTADAGPRDGGGTSDGATVDAGPSDGGALDAGPEDAGHELDAGMTDAGGATDVAVDVVVRPPVWNEYVPLEDVRVRVDGTDGTTAEGTTDASGRAVVSVPEGSGPWTVTAAHPGHHAVSLIGVEGPIEGAIHLTPAGSFPSPATRAVTGTISGDVSGSTIRVWGPGVLSFTHDPSGDYTLDIADRTEAGTIRLLASESVGSLGAPPSNAAWLDIDFGASDLSGIDIVLPSPARAVTTSSMTLQVPTSDAVDASSFTHMSDGNFGAFRMEDGFGYPVGNVTATSATAGSFDLEVNAFTGDMDPTQVGLRLSDGGQWNVYVNVRFADGSTFTVPAAVTVEASGENLGDVRLTVDAPAYAHVGASIVPGWFVYSWASGPFVDQPWPELPSGMTTADVGIDPTSPAGVTSSPCYPRTACVNGSGLASRPRDRSCARYRSS